MDLELAAMQIVGNAGESRSLCFEALSLAKKGEFEEAEKKLREAREVFLKAHEVQTELITEEVEGVILNEKIISEIKSFEKNMFILKLEVQMEVGKQKGEADSNYQIKVSNLKTIYNDGDKLALNIEVSQDSYIYIFIKDENDKVYEYYPNIYQKENLLSAKNILKFPDSRIFDIELNSNGKDTLENLIVLACKEPLNLLGFKIDKETGLSSESYKDLIEQIIKIDKSKLIKYSGVYKVLGGK